MSVTPISNQRLDAISQLLLKRGWENWCSLNWGFDKSDEEIQALVEGRGDGEELAQIPRYLSGEDEDGNPHSAREESKSHFDKTLNCGGTLSAVIRVPPAWSDGFRHLTTEFDDRLSSNYRISLRGRTLQ